MKEYDVNPIGSKHVTLLFKKIYIYCFSYKAVAFDCILYYPGVIRKCLVIIVTGSLLSVQVSTATPNMKVTIPVAFHGSWWV
jgi:hypothetical protein